MNVVGTYIYERNTVDVFVKSRGRRCWFGINERMCRWSWNNKRRRQKVRIFVLIVLIAIVKIYLSVCFTNQRGSLTVYTVCIDGWCLGGLGVGQQCHMVMCDVLCVFQVSSSAWTEDSYRLCTCFVLEIKKWKTEIWFFGLPLSLNIACQVVDGRAW